MAFFADFFGCNIGTLQEIWYQTVFGIGIIQGLDSGVKKDIRNEQRIRP